MTKRADVLKLVLAVAGCEVAGGVGALTIGNAVDTWYPTLRKPPYNPPPWVFGPVWTLLYALMGGALHIVSARGQEQPAVRQAQALFAVQLALNVIWTYLFFGRRSPAFALVEIVFLWVAIVLTVGTFLRVSRVAALLLLPYLAWVSFATALNLSIWRLNH